MQIEGSVLVVTGAARGIGRAVCREMRRRGAAGIVIGDLDADAAAATAAEFGGIGFGCDVADEPSVRALVDAATARYGRIDVFLSNAGFGCAQLDLDDPVSAPNATWQRMWDVHVMAHVYAARAVLPGMLAQGGGSLVNVASAAGLLSQTGDVAYSATKHAAVSLAESIAILHGDRGIRVSVVCPQYVATAITGLGEDVAPGAIEGVLTVEQAANIIVDGIAAERFLILTHPEVLTFFQRKAGDYERWLRGMRRVRDGLRTGGFLAVKKP
jgi:NAD(P)-dependent dehydrogenase (short-subunit alcohol dehydrogenase family)